VPARPRSNGWLPVPGWTGAHEWNGMVPYEDMPHSIAPANGMIVTANNRVVAPSANHIYRPIRCRRTAPAASGSGWQNWNAPPPNRCRPFTATSSAFPRSNCAKRLRSIETPTAAKELRELILGWNGEMRAIRWLPRPMPPFASN